MSSAPRTASDTFVSLVVPLRDAAEYVEEVVLELERVAQGLFRQYEIVLVDDASTDNTVQAIESLQKRVQNTQLYCLNRRSGLEVALVAGLDNSIGDFVFTLNAAQDPIGLIPVLWAQAQNGNEVVCGVRSDYAGGFLSRSFHRLLRMATGLPIPFGISDLRLYSRRVVNYISQNNDRHRLLKVLPFFTAYRIANVEYAAQPRGGGFGKSGLVSSILRGVSVLLASSILPLRILTAMTIMASSFSLAFAVYVVAIRIFKRHVVEGWVSLALPMAVMFFFVSTILGILSEYIYTLAQQSGNRPVYSIVKESTSSVLELRQKLNVVESSGEFAKAQKPGTLR